MKKTTIITIAVIMMVMLIPFSGCTTQSEPAEPTKEPTEAPTPEPTPDPAIAIQALIEENLETKLQALTEDDMELYLATITKNDEYYYNEQKRWFDEMTTEGFSSISFDLLEVELIDDTTISATINQKHFYNEYFDITYPLKYKLEDGVWLDYGYNFLELKQDGYTIKYMDGEENVEAFAKMMDTAIVNLSEVFEEGVDPNFEMKLFWDREMLRQRTIPSIGWLFTGWGEPNESLKLYTGHEGKDGYYGTIQHELVHHITIKVCNNNLPGWIHDGIALYYGNFQFEPDKSHHWDAITKEGVKVPIEYLEFYDLWDNAEQLQTYDWYNASYVYVVYLLDTYGHDTFMDLYREAGKKPFNDTTTNENSAFDVSETMSEAFEAVLGKTKLEIQADYYEWLDGEGDEYFK